MLIPTPLPKRLQIMLDTPKSSVFWRPKYVETVEFRTSTANYFNRSLKPEKSAISQIIPLLHALSGILVALVYVDLFLKKSDQLILFIVHGWVYKRKWHVQM